MKNLYTELDCYENIGFDLDGTLYDEFDFVEQVYHRISALYSEMLNVDANAIKEVLINNWMIYGNTNCLFQKSISTLLENHEDDKDKAEELLSIAIQTYREIKPKLVLSHRVQNLLQMLLRKNKKIFLVTDGSTELQVRKILSLGINKFFSKDKTIISGSVKKGACKTDPILVNTCLAAIDTRDGSKTIYCGDREIDKEFAHICKFDYQKMLSGIVVDQILNYR